MADGSVVVDLRDMRALEVDVESQTAWAETGLTAGEYSRALAEHHLATGGHEPQQSRESQMQQREHR